MGNLNFTGLRVSECHYPSFEYQKGPFELTHKGDPLEPLFLEHLIYFDPNEVEIGSYIDVDPRWPFEYHTVIYV